MSYENNIAKIKNFSGKALIFTRAAFVTAVLLSVLMIISAVMMAADLSPVTTASADGSRTAMSTASAFSQSMKWLVCCVMLAVIMFVSDKLFRGIKRSGSPFRTDTCRKMKQISVLLVLLATVPPVIGTVLYIIFMPVPITMHQLFNVQQIVFSTSNLFTALVFFIVAKVFDYGCGLQQESDETL